MKGTTSPLAQSALANSPLGQAAAGLDSCVHCGFCLPACPTYVNLHDENDSPRGRLVLMRRLLDGDLALDNPDLGTHLDRCLGCRACETACPSGVPYGALLEATRATMRTSRPAPRVAQAVLSIFKRTRLLSVLLFGARVFRATGIPKYLAPRLPARLGFPLAMLASSARTPLSRSGRRVLPPADDVSSTASHTESKRSPTDAALPPASGAPLALLSGCVMEGLFSHTNRATQRVMQQAGYRLVRTGSQSCCGALHAHAGDLESARELARRNIAAFEAVPDALIGVNSAGCGAMLKEYGHLLHDDGAWYERAVAVASRVRDVSELLASGDAVVAQLAARVRQQSMTTDANADANAAPATASTAAPAVAHTSAPPTLRVTYDPPCHLMHAQRVTREPLALLRTLPHVELIPLPESEQCCGSAGIYNLVEPDTSDAVLAPKLRHIASTRADYVATGNPGCLMQIGAGLLRQGSNTRAVHPIELLDAELRNDLAETA